MNRIALILAALLCMASRHPDRMIRADLVLNCSYNRGDATDRSWHAKNGTLTNGAVVTAGTRVALLDGVNDYIAHADSDNFTFNTGGQDQPFSVSAWVKLSASADVGKTIIAKGASVSPARFEWAIYASANAVAYKGPAINLYNSDATQNIYAAVSANVVPAGTWTHLAFTYSGSEVAATGLEVYVNGVASADVKTSSASYTGMSNTSAAVRVGSRELSGLYLGGDMDDVRIYNRELSPAEVMALFSEGRQ